MKTENHIITLSPKIENKSTEIFFFQSIFYPEDRFFFFHSSSILQWPGENVRSGEEEKIGNVEMCSIKKKE